MGWSRFQNNYYSKTSWWKFIQISNKILAKSVGSLGVLSTIVTWSKYLPTQQYLLVQSQQQKH